MKQDIPPLTAPLTTPQSPTETPALPNFSPEDILARTLWGEARGEGLSGMEAVASTVLNRLAYAKSRAGGKFWWGSDISSICLKPWQFSCWNENDPNYQKLLKIDSTDPNFQSCQRIARRAIGGILKDSTKGATHYHHQAILPDWAKGRPATAQIGLHIFYRVLD